MSVAALNLWGKTVEFVIQKVREIVIKITAASGTFTTPSPTLTNITSQVDILEIAFEAAEDGGKSLKAQVRIENKQMLFMMSLLRDYVQNTSAGNATLIMSAGFDVKSRQPVGLLPPPSNVRCDYGKHPGEIIVRWDGVPKRQQYKLQMNSGDPNDQNSWENVPDGDTGKKRFVVGDLTPGQMYWFRIFTKSAVGYSGPSDVTGHRAA